LLTINAVAVTSRSFREVSICFIKYRGEAAKINRQSSDLTPGNAQNIFFCIIQRVNRLVCEMSEMTCHLYIVYSVLYGEVNNSCNTNKCIVLLHKDRPVAVPSVSAGYTSTVAHRHNLTPHTSMLPQNHSVTY